jgi:ankyrin repeat protein
MWQLAKTLPSNPQDDVDRLTELCRRGSDLAIPLINSMTKEQLDLKCKFGPNKEHLPITAAIMGNNIDVVKALVEKGVNLEEKDARTQTTGKLFGLQSKNKVIRDYFLRILLNGPPKATHVQTAPSVPQHSYKVPLVVETAVPDRFEHLVSTPTKVEPDFAAIAAQTAHDKQLREACSTGDLGEVKQALNKGADPNGVDESGNTALLCVRQCGDALEITRLLLNKGAWVDAQSTKGGWTPLFQAVFDQNPERIELLLNCGANPLHRDGYGRIALQVAALSMRVKASTLHDPTVVFKALLLKRGREQLEAKDGDGWTIVDIVQNAKRNGERWADKFLTVFNQYLPKPEPALAQTWPVTPANMIDAELWEACAGADVEKVCGLLQKKADANVRHPQRGQNTALHQACAGGSIEVMDVLLKTRLEPNVRNAACLTPLMIAVDKKAVTKIEMLREYSISWHGNADYVINHQVPETGNTALHRAAWNSDRQMMETLINAGADQTLLNNDRKTANELLNQRLEPVNQRLREACSKGDLDGVNKALQSGADPNAKDEFDNTALHYAARNGTPTLMQVLIGSGANPNVANSEGKTPLDIWKSK